LTYGALVALGLLGAEDVIGIGSMWMVFGMCYG